MDGSRVQTAAETPADRHKHVEANSATPQGPGGRRGDAGAPAQGLRGKCQAKHTSMEARRRCQGVLMQPA